MRPLAAYFGAAPKRDLVPVPRAAGTALDGKRRRLDTNSLYALATPLESVRTDLAPWLAGFLRWTADAASTVYCLPRDSIVAYAPKVVDADWARRIVAQVSTLPMREGVIWNQPTPREIIRLADRPLSTSERARQHSTDVYGAVGQVHVMPSEVRRLLDVINESMSFLPPLNSCIINRYRRDRVYDSEGQWVRGGGKDSIAMHRDKAYLFDGPPLVVSVSLGQARCFAIRYEEGEERPAPTLRFSLGDGAVLVMGGETNLHCMHGIAKEPDLVVVEDRFSLTFRRVVWDTSIID